MNKSNEKQKNRVDSSISYKCTVINSNSNTSCKTCNKCLISVNHDQCVVRSEMFVKQSPTPFYLRQAKKAQPALYDGDELLKPHHVLAMTLLVHYTNFPSTSKKLPLVPCPTHTSDSSESVKYFPILHCLYLTRVHVNSITVNHVSDKMNFL
ncbi:hypothetical protein Tco_1137993 [Tanacetum coccineum]